MFKVPQRCERGQYRQIYIRSDDITSSTINYDTRITLMHLSLNSIQFVSLKEFSFLVFSIPRLKNFPSILEHLEIVYPPVALLERTGIVGDIVITACR